jgi:8-oxo-dGTP pyrophosphatase MutT (NUDIX family)
MSTTWRPHPIVRPVAIGVFRRGDQLLVVAMCDDAGAIKGWRPPSGTIERAAEALRREFTEELGREITEPRLITVIENLYEHHGARPRDHIRVRGGLCQCRSLSAGPLAVPGRRRR